MIKEIKGEFSLGNLLLIIDYQNIFECYFTNSEMEAAKREIEIALSNNNLIICLELNNFNNPNKIETLPLILDLVRKAKNYAIVGKQKESGYKEIISNFKNCHFRNITVIGGFLECCLHRTVRDFFENEETNNKFFETIFIKQRACYSQFRDLAFLKFYDLPVEII